MKLSNKLEPQVKQIALSYVNFQVLSRSFSLSSPLPFLSLPVKGFLIPLPIFSQLTPIFFYMSIPKC